MKKPSLLIIFLTVFIDLIGFGIVLPLVPYYGDLYGAGGFLIGLIIASYSAMQFLFSPVWGRWSDRVGRRPVILVSLLGSTLSYALFAVSGMMEGVMGLYVLLGSRVFAGVCGANLSVASAYIADITPPEKRSQGMAMIIGMAMGLGFIVGPALGGLSSSWWGLSGPGWVASGICGFNLLLACGVLQESWKPGANPVPRRPRWAQTREFLKRPGVGQLMWIYFLATFCFACFESSISLMLKNEYGLDRDRVSYLFAYCGVIGVVVQGGLVGRLVKRMGEPWLVVVGLGLVGVSLCWMPFPRGLGGIMMAMGLFAVGSSIPRAPIFGLISLNASGDEQGAILGVNQSMGSLARILGPIFAVTLYDWIYYLPYLICGGVAILAGGWAWKSLVGAGLKTGGGVRSGKEEEGSEKAG